VPLVGRLAKNEDIQLPLSLLDGRHTPMFLAEFPLPDKLLGHLSIMPLDMRNIGQWLGQGVIDDKQTAGGGKDSAEKKDGAVPRRALSVPACLPYQHDAAKKNCQENAFFPGAEK